MRDVDSRILACYRLLCIPVLLAVVVAYPLVAIAESCGSLEQLSS